MNRGVMLKAAIETWPSTLLCALLLFGAEAAVGLCDSHVSAQFTESHAADPVPAELRRRDARA